MKKNASLLQWTIALFLTLLFSLDCNAQTPFANGADVGWLSQMEATGYKFYDTNGTQKECLQLLKDRGINTIRLRVWVNPSTDKLNGHCSKAETVAMAVRAKNMGMRVMIDFHYSDSWADPSKQTKPATWASHTFSDLLNDVYNHTYDVLNDLKTAGVTPEWVQIGNEIPGGILWPEGSISNWSQLAQLLNKGYDATKAIDPSIKVVIHLDKGNDNARFRIFFDKATTNGVKYDVIGMSYYPHWLGTDYTATIINLESNLKDMSSRYNKEVMVVEVGGDNFYPQNTYDMLIAVLKAVKAVPDNKGLGVIYWEPQAEKTWSGYVLNSWAYYGTNAGKPTFALDAFKQTIVPNDVIKLSGTALTSDITLGTVDGINYIYNNASLSVGTAKFVQESPSTNTWSNADFPSGIGTPTGDAIATLAGMYNITFNKSTGYYKFTPVTPPLISIIGAFNGSCWNSGCDIDLIATTYEDYSLVYNFTATATLKFRQDHTWGPEWRAPNANNPTSLTGVAVAASGAPNFIIPAGNYTINFNRITGVYSFTITPLGLTNFNKKTISVYPNPTSSSWNFTATNSVIKNIKIFDVLGNQIINANPNTNSATIDSSVLTKGIYFAKIAGEDTLETIKLIKN